MRAGRIGLGIGILLTLVLCFAVPAKSALVSGRVYSPKGKVVPNTQFTVTNAKGDRVATFTTDGTGTYGVSLNPGVYSVRSKDKPGWVGEVRGSPQPGHEDIHLHPGT
ncbi:MAG: carboxypeptidase-like regulatory domain-containing protein [Acidobacteriota bacterium]|jgi:hypothetical protein